MDTFEKLIPSLSDFLGLSSRPQDAVCIQRRGIYKHANAAFSVFGIIILSICIMSPTYLLPNLTRPGIFGFSNDWKYICLGDVLLLLFGWQLFGFWLLWIIAPITKARAILAYAVLYTLCILPLLAAPFLGPALWVINNSLCNGLTGG